MDLLPALAIAAAAAFVALALWVRSAPDRRWREALEVLARTRGLPIAEGAPASIRTTVDGRRVAVRVEDGHTVVRVDADVPLELELTAEAEDCDPVIRRALREGALRGGQWTLTRDTRVTDPHELDALLQLALDAAAACGPRRSA